MLIKFTANDVRLHIEGDGIIPSGCVKTPDFSVSFSQDWEGYSVTAQFSDKSRVLHVAEIEHDKEYPIPWECLIEAGAVTVSLMGVNGDKVKTTLPAALSVRSSAITNGSQPQTPTENAYQQYVNLVNGRLDSAYNDFEHSANKVSSMFDLHDDASYPTVGAVENYVSDIMHYELFDEMAENSIWGIATPSATVNYVLKKTYKPTWHKTTVTITDDKTTTITLKDISCYGAKAFTKTTRASNSVGMSLYLSKKGEDTPFYRIDGAEYINSSNEFTYGMFLGKLDCGMWDGEWCSAAPIEQNMWVTSYKPKLAYRKSTEADYPIADVVTVRSMSNSIPIPKGSEIEIWRLY